MANQPQRYTVTFTTGTWHHIVMTYDGTNVTGYVDGSQVSQAAELGNGTNCSPDSWSAFGGGVSNGSPVNGFDGTMDETAVWSRALTSTETSQLYSSGIGQQYPFASTSPTSFVPIFAYLGSNTASTTGIFGDVNGDGLSDFEQWLPGYAGRASFLGNGGSWTSTSSSQFLPPKDFTTPSPTASMLVDVNGDGLDDWLYSDGTSTYALLNNGTGWDATPAAQWTIATSTLYKSPDVRHQHLLRSRHPLS